MDKLLELIQQLEAGIPHIEKLNPSVSQTAVGWHIHHSLIVIRKIISALERSEPGQYKWKFNRTRSFVFTFNKIPRGKGKAPASVQPGEIADAALLQEEVRLTKEKVQVLDTLHRNSHFEHPYFGSLNRKRAYKFLGIHTRHHLAIISDIVKGEG